MGRIIGIDFGLKRIGLAVTDPLQLFASPLTTVSQPEFNTYIAEYRKSNVIDAFVIGYPVQMNNQPSESVKYLKPFIGRLRKDFPDITIHLEDERFTSKMAFSSMIEGGVSKKERRDKSIIDKVSASIILQSFLDKRKMKSNV